MENYNYYSTHPSEISKAKLKNKMSEYISDSDLTHYLGRNYNKKIIKYSDLADVKSIDKLLPGKKNSRIILLENERNSGHWVLLIKDNNTIEYFNSYGKRPSIELDYNSPEKNKQLNQDHKYLNDLLTESLNKYDIIYNKIPFQKLDDNVATCGKHTLFRYICWKILKMDLYNYIQFMNELKKKFKMDADYIVTMLINSH